MNKTETIHTRVTPEIKREAEKIFDSIGLTTSKAISLFLTSVVNHKGIPFELSLPEQEDDWELAKSIASVDGGYPSKEAEKIYKLYSKGEIDYETAQFAIGRIYKK